MKGLIASLNIFILISIIFFLSGIILFFFGLSGMAIAIPFFSKVTIMLSLACFLLGIVFYLLKKRVKVKIEEKE